MSPVIGVMLMLVVCIIVAAVVSGFAGGLAGDTKKAPQIALGAKVIAGLNITLIHQSGDPLAWENIEFRTFIPNGVYKGTTKIVNLADGTYVPTSGPILTVNGANLVYAPPFRPGDEARFKWEDCFAFDGSLLEPKQGEQVVLQLFDKVSGKMIVEKTMTVGLKQP